MYFASAETVIGLILVPMNDNFNPSGSVSEEAQQYAMAAFCNIPGWMMKLWIFGELTA